MPAVKTVFWPFKRTTPLLSTGVAREGRKPQDTGTCTCPFIETRVNQCVRLRSWSGSVDREEWLLFPPYTLVDVFSSVGVENCKEAKVGKQWRRGQLTKKGCGGRWPEVFGTKPVLLKRKKERKRYETIHSPLLLLKNEPWGKGKEVETQKADQSPSSSSYQELNWTLF